MILNILLIFGTGCACTASRESAEEVMKTMGESSEECCQSESVQPSTITRSSSAASDDSSSDLMEHFMSELDLVFSDILAEEVSR